MSKFLFHIEDTEYIATVDTVYDLRAKAWRGYVSVESILIPDDNDCKSIGGERQMLQTAMRTKKDDAVQSAKQLLIAYLEENGKYFSDEIHQFYKEKV
jgi:hypothetical protein